MKMRGKNGTAAVVFFARDFLADEFSRLGACWNRLNRVYIVASAAERTRVLANDPAGEVILLFDRETAAADTGPPEPAINFDRHLRYLDHDEITAVVRGVKGAIARILERYRVHFYLDEPVSGYPNWEFNRAFTENGALCLHFQVSWVPGYWFFTRDAAQSDPVPLGLVENGLAVAEEHVKSRLAGLARPQYVLDYANARRRMSDAALNAGKGVYRQLFRRGSAYIDRDPTAHFLHARSLIKSFAGGYANGLDEGLRHVIFPLHYEPEAVLNYFSTYRRQEEIAAQLLDSLPLGWQLVLKEHPSQPGALNMAKWDALRDADRVLMLRGDYPGSEVFRHRPVVVSIGSTFALEAALAGCPAGVLGGVHFADAPGVERLDRPDEWARLVERPAASDGALARWYGDFLDRFCFKGTVMRGRTDFGDQDRLIDAFHEARRETVACA